MELWEDYPQFRGDFQETYDGTPYPIPVTPDAAYQICIYKWLYQLQAYVVVGGIGPTAEETLAAHEKASRICKKSVEDGFGEAPKNTWTAEQIEQANKVFGGIVQEGKRQKKKKSRNNKPTGDGDGTSGRGFGKNPSRFQLNREEWLSNARLGLSSTIAGAQNKVSDPAWRSAVWSGVRSVKMPVAAPAPRGVFVP
ncbi:MAG: hypothetical protein M1823_004320 [Watsoniomyces obsoletus]|nr:MAG: hypothetical protein M1823_004320 [Watsoniomyces obsoletus]